MQRLILGITGLLVVGFLSCFAIYYKEKPIPTVIVDSKIDYTYLGEFSTTFYCNPEGNKTFVGHDTIEGVTVASHSTVIPMHNFIYIEGIGTRYTSDTGSAVKGNTIDVYVEDCKKAIQLGRQQHKVYLLQK